MEENLRPGLKISATIHAAVVLLMGFQAIWAWFFPVTMPAPSLRVDIVDLPDMLKKDLEDAWIAPPEMTKRPPQSTSKTPNEITEEMVLKPKKPEKLDKRAERLQNVLKKFQAVENDTDDAHESELEKRILTKPIKGNQLSEGNSLSGDAREGGQAGYPEQIKVSMRMHWNLPIWLKRQMHSAQVRIQIDSSGRIVSTQFVKSSGNASFDEYVTRTLEACQPLPRPPEELTGTLLTRGILVGFPL